MTNGDWAKLAGCVALDLAGDASELIPVLGEFTDVAYAPVEAGLLKVSPMVWGGSGTAPSRVPAGASPPSLPTRCVRTPRARSARR